jgi:tetratricopeptide (TPR) repeat protein
LKLSTEGLERPTQVKKESNLPFIFLIGFVLLISLAGYLYNQGKLYEVYLSTKEKFIGLNLDEKKKYLGILYSKRDLVEATKVLQQIISFPYEDTEQNKAFLALLYFSQEDYEKALLIYKKLMKESDSPEQYIFYYASCLFH